MAHMTLLANIVHVTILASITNSTSKYLFPIENQAYYLVTWFKLPSLPNAW